MEFIKEAGIYLTNLLTSLGVWGAVLGCFFILFESIIPPVPLALFITLNFIAFGPILGFILSWIFTCLGCILSYYIFKNGIKSKYLDKLKQNDKFNNILSKIKKMPLSSLAVLIAIPFTPAFLVNIAAGISKVESKKFITAILIGKISLVYFCGFIGVSLVKALSNPWIIIRIVLAVIIAYLLSKILTSKFKL